MLTVSNNTSFKFKESKTHRRIKGRLAECIYEGSAFEGMKSLSSRAKGSEIEKLVEEAYRLKNPEAAFTKNINSDHDRIIDGLKCEIKGSFLWKDKKKGEANNFTWQQIRPGYDVDCYIFVAIYPDRAEVYQAAKQEVEDFVLTQNSKGEWVHKQHTKKSKDSKLRPDTFWIKGAPSDFPFMKLLMTVPAE